MTMLKNRMLILLFVSSSKNWKSKITSFDLTSVLKPQIYLLLNVTTVQNFFVFSSLKGKIHRVLFLNIKLKNINTKCKQKMVSCRWGMNFVILLLLICFFRLHPVHRCYLQKWTKQSHSTYDQIAIELNFFIEFLKIY